jgi:hypothetical protein
VKAYRGFESLSVRHAANIRLEFADLRLRPLLDPIPEAIFLIWLAGLPAFGRKRRFEAGALIRIGNDRPTQA